MNKDRSRLAERLRSLREAEGVSGNRLAQRLGWAQPRVSRLETGRQLPTDEDLVAWTKAVRGESGGLAELRDLLASARLEYETWKDSYRATRGTERQLATKELERKATLIGEFQPAFIPGLLQTAAYAREALLMPCGPLKFGSDEEDIEGMVAQRIERQRVLYESPRVQLVVLEAALRAKVCSTDTLAGQLDRLLAIATLEGVEFGVIPFETQLPVWPLASFMVYKFDGQALIVAETVTGEQRIDAPDEVALYVEFFDMLRESARVGTDAVPIIQRSLAALRDYDTDTH